MLFNYIYSIIIILAAGNGSNQPKKNLQEPHKSSGSF